MSGMSAPCSLGPRICVTYCMCYFVILFRSLSFLVKLEQLDLGSNELEVLVSQQVKHPQLCTENIHVTCITNIRLTFQPQ